MTIVETIREEVSKRLPKAEVKVSEIKKTNLTYTGLIIKPEDSYVAPTINLDEVIKDINNEKITVDEAIEQIISVYNDAEDDSPIIGDVTAESILENVFLQVINKDINEDLLKDVLSRDLEGLNLCFVPYVNMGRIGNRTIGYKVTKTILDYCKLSEEQLFVAAEKNTHPVIKSMSEIIRDIMISDGMPEDVMPEDVVDGMAINDDTMLICSNADRRYGAGAVFVGNTLKNVSDKFDDDVIILPSSVHEVILLPAGKMAMKDAKEMVCSVNKETVSEADFLADNVYLYHRDTDKISVA